MGTGEMVGMRERGRDGRGDKEAIWLGIWDVKEGITNTPLYFYTRMLARCIGNRRSGASSTWVNNGIHVSSIETKDALDHHVRPNLFNQP